MANAFADYQLLFGLLALQNGIISQDQLLAAFEAWTRDQPRSLADHLEARGDLTAARRALLEGLAAVHLEVHGGNVETSLAAVTSGRATHVSLAGLDRSQIEATITRLLRSEDEEATVTYDDRAASDAIGTATSNGQRFRILRPHARGALGAVFVAIDAELNREVALKQILDRHADDAKSRKRFLIEAEITGGLEHPGIVPVYGLGTDRDGRPYYAMRFIKGESLKEAIKRFHGDGAHPGDQAGRSLAFRKLLHRFIDVCNAIEYAHSRGVLHRDIKPGNIIVGKYGETLVVDWGLAKSLGHIEPGHESGERILVPSSASGSAETLPGSALGTPAYMSPEQASGELDRLGCWSDVYSLGATLYCLLTGRPPFDKDEIGELLDKVRQGGFVPPRSLDPAIDPALEAVCLKAMALEPNDRYTNCRALADDLERWLADEPVTAWREPFTRRARRWAWRNRTAVISLAASVLVALAGTAVVLVVQTRANAQLIDANLALKEANTREKQRFNLAMEAIKLFHGEVGDDLVLKADQFKPLRDKLLRGALNFYGKLEILLQGQPDRGSRVAMADAYFELAELTSKIGDKPEALVAHRKGLAVRRELAAEPADNGDSSRGYEARSLLATAILMNETGASAEALARSEEARDILEGLPLSGPGSSARRALLGEVYMQLGDVFKGTGKWDAAMAAYQRSLETLTRLAEDHPDVPNYRRRAADSHIRIGNVHLNRGKLGEALESYHRAQAIQQKLVDRYPDMLDVRNGLAATQNNIGAIQAQTGHPTEALDFFQRALANTQKLADANPAVTNFQLGLANNHGNIGILLALTGKPVEALESNRKALRYFQKLADDNPAVTAFQSSLAAALGNIGTLLVQTGKPEEAVGQFSREAEILSRLVKANPSAPDHKNDLASSQTNFATALLRLGKPAEARALSEHAVELRQALVKEHPENPSYRAGLGVSLLRSGQSRRDEGDAAGAAADWRLADANLEQAGELEPENIFLHGCCHASLSWAATEPASRISSDQAKLEAAKALELIRLAAEAGYNDLAAYRNETALNPLRNQDDFRLLMMDLAMPPQPFTE